VHLGPDGLSIGFGTIIGDVRQSSGGRKMAAASMMGLQK